MNLFIGVIFVHFTEEQRKEKVNKYNMVTDDQMRWIMVQDLTLRARPDFDLLTRPKNKIRQILFRLITSKGFETTIMGCIILNIISMGFFHEGISTNNQNLLTTVNLVFTMIFLLEAVLKLTATDFQYFKFAWNIYDFIIALISLLDILLGSLGGSKGILKQAPQYARMIRVLRVSRLFKLMKARQLEGINKIIKTLVFSFPSLLNVLVLLFLIYFVFSVLAVFLFKNAPFDRDYNNEVFNYRDFHHAIVTLFRCSTGEDWHQFMYFHSKQDGKRAISIIFFLSYIFLTAIVMLKVFQLVVMKQFDEFYFNPDNPLNSFQEISERFKSTWNYFTRRERGLKIRSSRLPEFFYYLE